MSRLSRPTVVGFGLVVVGLSFVVDLSFVVGLSFVVVGGGVAGVVVGFDARGLYERRAPTRLSTVPAPRSLRWVRGLLPGDEGAAWWAEVTSCLAETPDPGERRRYVRSYRRNVPQLIWTSWAEHLSASRQRELL